MSDSPLGPLSSAFASTSTSPSLPRPTGKRTASIPSTSDPLSASSPSTSPSVTYPTYHSHRRKTSVSSATPSLSALDHAPSPSGSTGGAAGPSPSLPPTSPSTAPHLPPLVSRPSEASVPKGVPAGRPYARSVSEARQALLGQNLKADLQGLGLTSDAAGAGMVQVLAGVGSGGEEWKNVRAAVETGKVTLLLPKEAVQGVLTPAFVADHLVLLESSDDPTPSNATRGFVTLTGLRGTLSPSQLVISSCGSALIESPIGLLKPGSLSPADFTDSNVHRALRGEAYPLPPQGLQTPHPFPTFALESELTSLSIPRASGRSVSGSLTPKQSTSSRLAALFAKTPYDSDPLSATNSAAPSPPPEPAAPATGGASTPPTAETSTTSTKPGNLQVKILVVNKAIRHAEMLRLVGKALDAHLRSSLNRIPGAEEALVERVCAFSGWMQPPASWKGVVPPPNAVMGESLFASPIDDISDHYQDLLHLARGDLQRGLANQGLLSEEEQVDAGLEQIEELLTREMYDRWFSPSSSGDAAEDRALAERMSELREELTLEHLGLDLARMGDDERSIRDSLEDISDDVSAKLAGLAHATCRSPSAKMTVFVEVHRVIVDGLSSLPPIPLKKETEVGTPNGLSRTSSAEVEVEMDDAPSSSCAPSVHITIPERPAQGEQTEDDETMKTPRPASAIDPEDTPPPLAQTSSPAISRAPTPASKPTSSSADLILPLLIYSLVQASPPTLASDLKFLHRFRAQDLFRGEGAYCATGVSAAVEFLIHADGAELGLPPSSIPSSSASSIVGVGAPVVGGGRLRLRASNVSQELDSLVDSANHALVGLADGGFNLFFGKRGVAPRTIAEVKNVLDGAGSVARSARGGLLRRATGASTPADDGLSPTNSRTGNSSSPQREMVDFVPTPQVELDQPDLYAQPEVAQDEDARSVRSFSSLLREPLVNRTRTPSVTSGEERSIGDRLASLPGLSRLGGVTGEASARPSIFSAFSPRSPTPANAPAAANSGPRRPTSLAASDFSSLSLVDLEPNARFLEAEAGDLRLAEVAELLEEYKRLAGVLMAAKEGLVGPAAGLGLGN